jgi:hypothetical protein
MTDQPSNEPEGAAQQGNPIETFLREDQDPAAVENAYSRVKPLLTSDEEILYIAVQKPLAMGLAPGSVRANKRLMTGCVVLTNKRFVVYKPKMLGFGGATFEDYIWLDLHAAHLDEGMTRATFTLKTVGGKLLSIGDLPKEQARKLYGFAQGMEERVVEERRARAMEEQRASAGGIVVHTGTPTAESSPTSQGDPVQKLKQLKEMLDAGLIEPSEYEAKKADVLANM